MTRRVAVIGAGTCGLACARRLVAGGADVAVYEAGVTPGGVTLSERKDGFLLELGPDSIISTKPAGLDLIRELGLEDQLQGTRPEARTSLIARGRQLIPVPEGVYLMAPGRMLPFARSPLISWPGKLRMGLDLLLPRRADGAAEESLAAFVRRRLGREALERLAQPLVGGIYTADPERLSLAATMPQFLEMERSHRSLLLAMRARSRVARSGASGAGTSGARYGLFVTLRNGLGALGQRLVEQLGPRLHCACRLIGLDWVGNAWRLHFSDGSSVDHDAVVLAVPAHVAARLVPDPTLRALLAGIPYADIATVNVALRAEDIGPLPPAAGFVVPAVDHRALIACTFVHQKYAGRAPEGRVLLRAFCGGALHPEDLDCDDERMVGRVLAELDWRFGLKAPPLFTRVARWPQAMAQYRVGHLRRVQLIDQACRRWPGLHLAGNGYEGVGIPDVVARGMAAADRLLGR